MGVSNQLLLTLITLLISTSAGKTCSIGIYLSISLQLRPNSEDASLILTVLLLWQLLPMLRTVVSIIMKDCLTMMVVNASSA